MRCPTTLHATHIACVHSAMLVPHLAFCLPLGKKQTKTHCLLSTHADAFRRAAAAAIKAPLLTSKVSSTTTGHHEAPPTLLSPLQVEILFIMFDDNGARTSPLLGCVVWV